MALRNGVQYASVREHSAPMHDPAVAARIADQVASFYPPAVQSCNCDWAARVVAAVDASIDAAIALKDNSECRRIAASSAAASVEHSASCASLQAPKPVDAVALLEKSCGRYVRGAHKGQLRGWAHVRVVTEGGWQRLGPGERNGRVVYPGTVLSIDITDFNGKSFLSVSL